MELLKKVIRTGNSNCVTIPKEFKQGEYLLINIARADIRKKFYERFSTDNKRMLKDFLLTDGSIFKPELKPKFVVNKHNKVVYTREGNEYVILPVFQKLNKEPKENQHPAPVV